MPPLRPSILQAMNIMNYSCFFLPVVVALLFLVRKVLYWPAQAQQDEVREKEAKEPMKSETNTVSGLQDKIVSQEEIVTRQQEIIVKLQRDIEEKDLALAQELERKLKLEQEAKEKTVALAQERKVTLDLHSQKRELVLALLWERIRVSNLKALPMDKLGEEGPLAISELQEQIRQRDERIVFLEKGLQHSLATEARDAAQASWYRKDGLIRYLPDPRTLPESTASRLSPKDFYFQAVQELMLSSLVPHRAKLNSRHFHPAAKLQVLEVDMVHSPALLDSYISQRALVQQRRPTVTPVKDAVVRAGGVAVTRPFSTVAAVDPRLNEALLFHGAPPNCLDQIVAEGFDPQRGGENAGAMYGIGTYFAHNVSKCDVYSKASGNLVKEVLLSRVLLGEAFLAERALGNAIKRPPDGFDSVVALARSEGGQVDHREYVIFNPSRACPMFRIKYKHLADCQCHQCQ